MDGLQRLWHVIVGWPRQGLPPGRVVMRVEFMPGGWRFHRRVLQRVRWVNAHALYLAVVALIDR